jgi:hypothetical protein
MDTLLQDIRYALRTLRRTPGFTLAAVLTIALGIGVNTAVFSLANAILLRPADAADPTRLVRVYSNTHSPLQREQLDYVSARSSTLTGLFGERYLEAALNTPQGNRKVNAELVSGSYFTTVGVGASLGRVFTRADDTVAAHGAVAVVSHRWWREAVRRGPVAGGAAPSASTGSRSPWWAWRAKGSRGRSPASGRRSGSRSRRWGRSPARSCASTTAACTWAGACATAPRPARRAPS